MVILTIKEWNITLNPFSAIYNRAISDAKITAGLGAIDDITLIGHEFGMASCKIYESDITNIVASNTYKFDSIPARIVTGDYILTTTNKLIILEIDAITIIQYIVQYNYLTG